MSPSKHPMLAAMLVLIASALCASGPIEQGRIERLVEQASGAKASQEWAAAEEVWREVLRTSPDHALASAELRSLHEQGHVSIPIDEDAVGALEAIVGNAFFRVETPWFIVLSDCDEVWTAARAGVLERAARQFRRMMDELGLAWVPPERKLACVLFAEYEDFIAFARAHDDVKSSWVAGYYATGTNRAVFYDEATSPAVVRAASRLDEADDRATRDASRELNRARKELETHARETSISKTIHEAVHMLAFNCGLQRRSRSYPFWFTEGLASSFETPDPRNAFGPSKTQDTVDRSLAQTARDAALFEMGDLISVTNPAGIDSGRAAVLYAQSNSFFRYLYRFEREELASYARALWHAEPRDLSGAEHAELFKEHLGDEAKLGRRWLKRYVER